MYEGFGLPILESMSCGTPCILSDVSSLPEVGGEACLYFAVGDADKLAELMKETSINDELILQYSKEAIKQADKFSWKRWPEKPWILLKWW